MTAIVVTVSVVYLWRKEMVRKFYAPTPTALGRGAEKQDKAVADVEIIAKNFEAPFIVQAPLGNWADPRQQNGCEEAAALMAVYWTKGRTLLPADAEKALRTLSDYELKTYGEYRDTSARDTAERLFKGYFQYDSVEVIHDIRAADIKKELEKGNVVIVPVNGRLLKNPYYTPPGPRQHMIVVKGYDTATKEFITNDPGTKRGENFRYDESILENALRDYPTGFHEPIREMNKAMIVVKPRVSS